MILINPFCIIIGINNLALVSIAVDTHEWHAEGMLRGPCEGSCCHNVTTYQGGVQEPGGHLPLTGHHAQVAQEVQLDPGGAHGLLGAVELRAHLLQKVVPVLVFQGR